MIRKVVASSALVALLVLVSACGSETQQQNENAQGAQQEEHQQQGSTEGSGGQLTNIGREPMVVYNDSSYVSPLTEVFGDVFIGKDNFVAASSVIRAAPGNRVELGDEATVQDNIIVRALDESVIIGDQSNLGHHAIVRDSKIGDSVYIGYNTEVDSSQVGNGSLAAKKEWFMDYEPKSSPTDAPEAYEGAAGPAPVPPVGASEPTDRHREPPYRRWFAG